MAHPFPWINLADLNFERGLAGEFTVDILQHMIRKEKINENFNCYYERGRATRGEIDNTRRLTGGSLFESKHIILDSEVLKYREGKEKEKEDEKLKTIQNAVQKYNDYKVAYFDLINGATDEKDYKGKHYKIYINWKKRSSDSAIPSKVPLLKLRFQQTKGRTTKY